MPTEPIVVNGAVMQWVGGLLSAGVLATLAAVIRTHNRVGDSNKDIAAIRAVIEHPVNGLVALFQKVGEHEVKLARHEERFAQRDA